jgi:phosphoadenosine phosphosulfate reductase
VWTYIHAYELPYNLLHEQGYPSIGCYPCTRPVEAGADDARAGRWTGRSKTECGIHFINVKENGS